MSYTGAQVYLTDETTVASVSEWLAGKLPHARFVTSARSIRIELSKGNIRLDSSRGPVVTEEANELADRAPALAAEALRRASWRIEIVPDDPRTDPDDIYNTLLLVFETLQAIPNGVGFDPFDGSFRFAGDTTQTP